MIFQWFFHALAGSGLPWEPLGYSGSFEESLGASGSLWCCLEVALVLPRGCPGLLCTDGLAWGCPGAALGLPWAALCCSEAALGLLDAALGSLGAALGCLGLPWCCPGAALVLL